MERGTGSRSGPPGGENGSGESTPPAETVGEPASPQTTTIPGHDARRGRVDREIPAPADGARDAEQASGSDGNGRGGNGKPQQAVFPPPVPPGMAQRQIRPRLKKLRLLFVIAGLGFLAMVSTVFGMMMAVSQDLPAIYDFTQYRAAKNSRIFDDTGAPIAAVLRARPREGRLPHWPRAGPHPASDLAWGQC